MVDPDGNRNGNARQTAKSGGHGVGGLEDLGGNEREPIEVSIDDLASERFEKACFDD